MDGTLTRLDYGGALQAARPRRPAEHALAGAAPARRVHRAARRGPAARRAAPAAQGAPRPPVPASTRAAHHPVSRRRVCSAHLHDAQRRAACEQQIAAAIRDALGGPAALRAMLGLAELATHPARQGRGYASALVRVVTDLVRISSSLLPA